MLTVVSLSQHRVSSSKTVKPRAPCGARCIRHAVSTWSAVCSEAPHSQFDEGTRPHLCMDEWNLSTPVRRRLSLTQAARGSPFYQDQTSERVGICLDVVVPFSSADKMFLKRRSQPEGPTCFSIETAVVSGSAFDYVSDCSSVHTEQSQSSTTSEYVPDAEPTNQNQKKLSNLARMSKRFQVSDRAAAIAKSVVQD